MPALAGKKGRGRSTSPKKKGTTKHSCVDASERSFGDNATLPVLISPRVQTVLGCVASSDIHTLSRLIVHYDHGSALAEVDLNGSTPLHLACRKGDPKMLAHLLSYGRVNIDTQEKKAVGGYAALHHACAMGCFKAVELLLSHGADVNIKADSAIGETPLHVCCRAGSVDCARVLLTAGVHTDTRDNYGNNASFWAAQRQNAGMIQQLGLPPSRTASADEYLKLIMERSGGKFSLPKLKKAKSKKSKDGKSGGSAKGMRARK